MHWFLPPLFLLIISQGALAQYPCDLPDAVEIPVSVPWIFSEEVDDYGYMWDTNQTMGVNMERIPVCLFITNQSFLEQCGNTTTLYQYRDNRMKKGDMFWMELTYYDNMKSRKSIATTFQSTENVCGLDLQPTYEIYTGYNMTILIGKSREELIALGYSVTFLGYSIPCDDKKDRVIWAKDPNYNPTTPKPTAKPCGKKWSEWEWVPGSTCNDTCGNCGSRARQRTCLTSGCTGAAEDTAACGNPVCMYPRMSCCGSYVVKVDEATNTHVCG